MAISKSGICRFCGCTDEDACKGGCFWTDAAKKTCSNCVTIVGKVRCFRCGKTKLVDLKKWLGKRGVKCCGYNMALMMTWRRRKGFKRGLAR